MFVAARLQNGSYDFYDFFNVFLVDVRIGYKVYFIPLSD